MPAPVERAETKYVTVGDADVAYRLAGEGPLDLLYFYGLGSHVDMQSDDPREGQYLDALASFTRLIFFDRRGTGASDGLAPNAMPAWEEWADDLRAVLDAVGSERTGNSRHGPRTTSRSKPTDKTCSRPNVGMPTATPSPTP